MKKKILAFVFLLVGTFSLVGKDFYTLQEMHSIGFKEDKPGYAEMVNTDYVNLTLGLITMAGYDVNDFVIEKNGVKNVFVGWKIEDSTYAYLCSIGNYVSIVGYCSVEE